MKHKLFKSIIELHVVLYSLGYVGLPLAVEKAKAGYKQ